MEWRRGRGNIRGSLGRTSASPNRDSSFQKWVKEWLEIAVVVVLAWRTENVGIYTRRTSSEKQQAKVVPQLTVFDQLLTRALFESALYDHITLSGSSAPRGPPSYPLFVAHYDCRLNHRLRYITELLPNQFLLTRTPAKNDLLLCTLLRLPLLSLWRSQCLRRHAAKPPRRVCDERSVRTCDGDGWRTWTGRTCGWRTEEGGRCEEVVQEVEE